MRRNNATAPRRALATSACFDAARNGMMTETLSSVARIADATRTNAAARSRGFKCAVSKYASIATRISTVSADGGGKLSAASQISTLLTDASPSVLPSVASWTGNGPKASHVSYPRLISRNHTGRS